MGFGSCCPAKCPSYDLLVHGHQRLSVVKTHSPSPAQGQDLGLGDPPGRQDLSLLHTFSSFQQLFQNPSAAVLCFTAPQSVRRSDKIFL